MIETRVVPEGYLWTKDAIGQRLDADRRYTVLYQRHVLAPGVATDWTTQNPKRASRLAALLTRRQARIVGELERALTIYAAKPSEGRPAHPLPPALVNTSVLIRGRVTRLDLSEEDVWLDGAVSCIKIADFSAYFARLHPPKKDDSAATLPTALNVGSNVAKRSTMEDVLVSWFRETDKGQRYRDASNTGISHAFRLAHPEYKDRKVTKTTIGKARSRVGWKPRRSGNKKAA